MTLITSRVQRITPAIAAEMLKKNYMLNRHVRSTHVAALATIMRNGGWMLTPQGISFDTGGALIDGQHRLHAVIHAGVSVDMMVFDGVEPEAYAAFDDHAKRTFADALGTERRAQEIVVFLVQLARHAVANRIYGYPTRAEVCQANDVLYQPAVRLCSAVRTDRHGLTSQPVRAAVAWWNIIEPHKEQERTEIYAAFVENDHETLAATSSPKMWSALAARLTTHPGSGVKGGGMSHVKARFQCAHYAFESYDRGRTIIRITDPIGLMKRAGSAIAEKLMDNGIHLFRGV